MASEESAHPYAARLAELRKKLEARTDRSGKPLKNYEENVEAIRAEISRLEGIVNGE